MSWRCKRLRLENCMATNTVNLDAMVPREDFAAGGDTSGGNPRGTISITDLDNGFFSNALHKPDFQRETTHWTPDKIVDLVKAFMKGDLIPAVILWQRGSRVFAIDGAHRLSALIAWISDDYGDGATSIKFFGGEIPDKQKQVAEKTRRLMKKEVGSYNEFVGMRQSMHNLTPEQQSLIARLGTNSIVAQWVTATAPEAAEASFFKINQAAQAIDPTEHSILQARQSARGIAARCIVRGGKGHKYWAEFDVPTQQKIEDIGAEVYKALYAPELSEPIKTLDIPVAGIGYNALPFVFDLVNLCNDAGSSDELSGEKFPIDSDGKQTLSYLNNVNKMVSLVTTNKPGSLGFHPAIYFYAMSGKFLPNAFLASVLFARWLDKTKKKKQFTEVREKFENYLFENKIFISLTVTKLGSRKRSLKRLEDLYRRIFNELTEGKTPDEVTSSLYSEDEFAHLRVAEVPPPNAAKGKSPKGKLSGTTKSAVFIKESMSGVNKCSICGGAVHSNSFTHDHILRVEDGGDARSSNVCLSHPFCNTGFKN